MYTKRKLTGKWYLKKTWWNYQVFVQVDTVIDVDDTYGNGGSHYVSRIEYQKARPEDFIELNINVT